MDKIRYAGKSREFKRYERVRIGMRVVVSQGAGIDSDRFGKIIGPSSDTHLSGAWNIQEDSGNVFWMFKSYLRMII